MQRASSPIVDCVAPVVRQLGYEYVGAEFGGNPGDGILRVYIDADAGVTVDDCSAVSERLSVALDVDEPIKEGYHLEVSSPGINRPLFEQDDFERFAGRQAFVRIAAGAIATGRRRFKGRLEQVQGNSLQIEVDGEPWTLPLSAVEEAHLVVDLDDM